MANTEIFNLSFEEIENKRFENTTFQTSLNFENKIFENDVVFTECIFSRSLNFSGCTFKKRVFFYSCTFEGDIDFSFAKFYGFSNFGSSIFSRECKFSFSNALSLINFSEIKLNSEANLDLHCSHFEKFANFDSTEIEYTNLSNDYLRENARLIKHYCIQMNDKVMAFKFHEYEMKATLSETKSWPDKFILILNRESSNFGTNWVRALISTLGTALFLFTIFYILGTENQSFQWGWKSLEDFNSVLTKGLKYFCVFLNPTHSLRDLEELQLNWVGYIIDLLARLFISYGIYQLVVSYQKYNRNI